MVISIFPAGGAVLYFLFGEANIGSGAFKRQKIIETVFSNSPDILGDAQAMQASIDPIYQPAFTFAASINGFQAKMGNTAELMPDETTARSRLIEDIDNAKVSVNVLYYIWLEDNTGTDLAEAMIRAAGRGVRCRAMADGLGSRRFISSSLWKKMQHAGIDTAVSLPISRPFHTVLFSRIDLRNHRKITVIDGKISYIGSQNCADPEFTVKRKYAPWVDIMLRVEGPVVAQNQLLFASDWMVSREEQLQSFVLSTDSEQVGFSASIIGDGPTERVGSKAQLFASLIGTATKTLTISTPYFVPNSIVLNAIEAAAYRGVRVTMIFPERNDSWIVSAASRSFYRSILASGASIYEYRGGLLHSKTLTIDSEVTFLGSSNMDLRSFDLNYENDLLLQDANTSKAVEERQQQYLQQSNKIEIAQVDGWPIYRRLWNNAIATMGPVL